MASWLVARQLSVLRIFQDDLLSLNDLQYINKQLFSDFFSDDD